MNSMLNDLTPSTDAWDRHITESVFNFLVDRARRKITTTYQEIALQFGLASTGNQLGAVLSPILGRIYEFCISRDMPFLTSIVVRKSGRLKGIPGSGFWTLYAKTLPRAQDTDLDRLRTLLATLQKDVYDFWAIDQVWKTDYCAQTPALKLPPIPRPLYRTDPTIYLPIRTGLTWTYLWEQVKKHYPSIIEYPSTTIDVFLPLSCNPHLNDFYVMMSKALPARTYLTSGVWCGLLSYQPANTVIVAVYTGNQFLGYLCYDMFS